MDTFKDFDEALSDNKEAALRWASMNGHLGLVKLLLDAGANVHFWEDFALRMASANGNVEVVKVLLDAGANVHAKDGSPLRLASKNDHPKVVKLLKSYMNPLKKKVTLEVTDEQLEKIKAILSE